MSWLLRRSLEPVTPSMGPDDVVEVAPDELPVINSPVVMVPDIDEYSKYPEPTVTTWPVAEESVPVIISEVVKGAVLLLLHGLLSGYWLNYRILFLILY